MKPESKLAAPPCVVLEQPRVEPTSVETEFKDVLTDEKTQGDYLFDGNTSIE